MRKKYRIDINAEKKTIVGNAWKAKMKPSEVSPASFVAPGGSASLPNRKRVPADAESSSVTTILFMKRKVFAPAGTTKTKTAKSIWSAIPQPTTRQFIARLFDEISQAKPNKMNMPQQLTTLYCPISVPPPPSAGSIFPCAQTPFLSYPFPLDALFSRPASGLLALQRINTTYSCRLPRRPQTDNYVHTNPKYHIHGAIYRLTAFLSAVEKLLLGKHIAGI